MIRVYRHIFRTTRPINWLSRRKMENQPQQANKEPQTPESQEYTKEEQSMIESFEQKSDKANLLDALMQTDSSSAIKDLIVARRAYQKDKSMEKLKNAILFEEILNNQIKIAIYDTKSRFVKTQFLKYFGIVAVVIGCWFCYYHLQKDKEFYIIVHKTYKGTLFNFLLILASVLVFGYATIRFVKNIRLHVQKIVYDTEKEVFLFHRRKLWGSRYVEQVNRHQVAYTENKYIWAMGANYFNVENRNIYEIAVKQAWLRQDLFSHLISQRIRRSMQT